MTRLSSFTQQAVEGDEEFTCLQCKKPKPTEEFNADPEQVICDPCWFLLPECKVCRGHGFRLVPNGPDDNEHTECNKCQGTGRIA